MASEQPLTPQEAEIVIDIHHGEGSEGVVAMNKFHVAKRVFFSEFNDRMHGNYESSEISNMSLSIGLAAVMDSLIECVQTEPDDKERAAQLAATLQGLVEDTKVSIEQFEVPVEINDGGIEQYEAMVDEMMEMVADMEGDFSEEEALIELRLHYQQQISNGIFTAIATGGDRRPDELLEQREERKRALKEASIQIAKIALGATAALVISKLWDKRSPHE